MASELLPIPIIPIGGGGGSAASRVVYVRGDGDDDTAAPYDAGLPFRTLEAASAAAEPSDNIVVAPGAYTTTANVAKDGVKWHFEPGAVVTHNGIEPLFDSRNFEADSFVTGDGAFLTSAGPIVQHSGGNLIFECNRCIVNANVSGIIATADLGRIIRILIKSRLTANLEEESEAAGIAIYQTSELGLIAYVHVGRLVTTINSFAVSVYGPESGASVLVDIPHLSGNVITNCGTWNIGHSADSNIFSTYGGNPSPILINGNMATLSISADLPVTLNGTSTLTSISSGSARLVGGIHRNFSSLAGDSTITIGGAPECIVDMIGGSVCATLSTTPTNINASGGEITIHSNNESTSLGVINVSGSRVNLRGIYKRASQDYFINLSGGILDLNDSIISMTSTAATHEQVAVLHSGGILISNGARISTPISEIKPIQARNTDNAIRVLGGLYTNYTASPIKNDLGSIRRFTINSVSSTTIWLNDGVNPTIIVSEANVGIYSTTSALAERLAALVNIQAGLGNIDAVASWSSGNRFYVTSTNLDQQINVEFANANVSHAIIAPRTYALTDSLNGVILQHADII